MTIWGKTPKKFLWFYFTLRGIKHLAEASMESSRIKTVTELSCCTMKTQIANVPAREQGHLMFR